MRNLRALLPYLARYRASIFLGLLILLAAACLLLFQPYLLRLGIDSLQAGKFEPVYCLIIAGSAVLQALLGFFQRWALNQTGFKIETDLRRDLFAKTQKLDKSFFDETPVGDLIVNSTSDITVQRNFLMTGIIAGFNTLFLGTIALILMFSQDWRMAIIGLIFLPPLVIAFSFIGRYLEGFYRQSQEQLGEVNNRAQEVFTGIRVVKAYTREEEEIRRYTDENNKLARDYLRAVRLDGLFFPLIMLGMGLTTAVVLWVGAHEIEAGRLTIGQFVQFNAYLLLLVPPLSNLGFVVGLAQQASASMGRLQEIFHRIPKISDPANPVKPEASQNGQVEFKGIGLRYGDRWVLRQVDFKVPAGKTVAVVGPTGAGKSSLSSLVGRVYDPHEGQVTLNGVDVRMFPLEYLRQKVAFVPQESLLFSLSLRDNIALGKSEAEDEEVLQAARLARLAQDLPQIPGGFDALIGERGVNLSGGQKQRTAIARALLPEAEVLILDDALSSVDARTQNLIAANLKILTNQGRTLLIVTQRLSLVKEADWIVVLDEGRVVDQGTHAELLKRDGLYSRMYRHELTTAQDVIDDDFVPHSVETPTTENETAAPPIPGKVVIRSEELEKQVKRKGKIAVDEGEQQDEIVIQNYEGGRLSRLVGYTWQYRKMLAISVVVIIISSGLELAGPLLSKDAIDNHITKGDLNGLDLILVLFLITAVAGFVFRYLRVYLTRVIGQYVVRDLRVELFRHLLGQSLSFFDKYSSGSLIGRLTSDMDSINEFLGQGAVTVISDLLTLVAIVATMFVLDWRLALVSLGLMPVLFVVTLYFRNKIRNSWRAARRKYSVLVGYLAENFNGMLTVQLFNRQKVNFNHFNNLNQEYFESNRTVVYLNGLFLPMVALLSSFATALLLLVGGWLYTGGYGVTFGLLVAFFQYTDRAFQPIRDIAERYSVFQAASTSTERIFGLLDQQPDVLDPANPRPLVENPARPWAEVEFQNVVFGYNPEFPVIKDVSFSLKAGEKVAIVGATGAGKTSVVSLLGRNYDIQEGRIAINGRDLREVAQKDLRRHLALVLQDPVLFKGTIAENIGLGRPDLTENEVREAARYVGAASFIEKLPGGYNYLLQEKGANISAGQRQLLSFARAIAYNPDAILILDEATSSVDTESEAIIQEALKKLLQKRTAIIIAHRLSTIRDVDRVIVVERGRIVENGSQEELLAQRGLYYQLYSNQMSLVNR